jgi:glutathione S-transferase
MSIEIYAFPPSPRAFKVMAVANYLGLDWTLRMLDLPKGGHKTPQYEALNPNLRMPTLKDGDYCGSRTRSANISRRRSPRAACCRRTSARGST